MSRYHRGRKRREFSKLNSRYVGNNYLKNLKPTLRFMNEHHDISFNEFLFLLKFYEYEFFTAKHAAEALDQNQAKLYERVFLPLMHKDLLEGKFDKTDMTMLDIMFEEPNKYRKRYGLTQRARLLVQQFYRKLEV